MARVVVWSTWHWRRQNSYSPFRLSDWRWNMPGGTSARFESRRRCVELSAALGCVDIQVTNLRVLVGKGHWNVTATVAHCSYFNIMLHEVTAGVNDEHRLRRLSDNATAICFADYHFDESHVLKIDRWKSPATRVKKNTLRRSWGVAKYHTEANRVLGNAPIIRVSTIKSIRCW